MPDFSTDKPNWIILTRHKCDFCTKAKDLLDSSGYNYTVYNLQEPTNRWLLMLIKAANLSTVPQIFSPNGDGIGGYTELRSYIVNNNPREF